MCGPTAGAGSGAGRASELSSNVGACDGWGAARMEIAGTSNTDAQIPTTRRGVHQPS